MNTYILYAAAILIIHTGYGTHVKQNDGNPELKPSTPVVIDTFKSQKIEGVIWWRGQSDYYPCYIGVYKDTLFTTYSYESDMGKMYDVRTRNYRKPAEKELSIVVDTSRLMADYSFMIWADNGTTTAAEAMYAYPVIVSNLSQDTLSIAQNFRIPLIMEAQDKDGQWKPIQVARIPQKRDKKFDATFFSPKEILITTVLLNHGTFKTKLRLRYNNILSNEYDGTIYLTQFDKEYDNSGPPKE